MTLVIQFEADHRIGDAWHFSEKTEVEGAEEAIGGFYMEADAVRKYLNGTKNITITIEETQNED